jgi:putative phosphoesterase
MVATMLVAVISDTHMPRGPRTLPGAFLERIAAADLLLHAGDFSTVAVLRELERLGPPVAGVSGNVDSAELRRLLPEQFVPRRYYRAGELPRTAGGKIRRVAVAELVESGAAERL